MINEFLKRGYENRTSLAELMRTFNMSSRAVRLQIEQERRNGALILSTTTQGGGYYLPKNREEIKTFVRSMEHRSSATYSVLKTTRSILNETEGQLPFEWPLNGEIERQTEGKNVDR